MQVDAYVYIDNTQRQIKALLQQHLFIYISFFNELFTDSKIEGYQFHYIYRL